MEIRDCVNDEQLNIYLDGELPAAEKAAVESHVNACGRCATRVEEMRAVGEALRKTTLKAVDEADFSGVWERVRSEAFPSQPVAKPRRSLIEEVLAGMRDVFSPALTAAAVILMVTVVYFTAGLKPPQPAPPPVMEAAVSNEAQIISLETDNPSVMVLQSPESGATIILISNNTPETDEEPTI